MFPEVQTPELCLAAVRKNGYALKFVNPEFQTPETLLSSCPTE